MDKEKPTTKESWTTSEVVELFQITEEFLFELEEEEIVCPSCEQNSTAKIFPHEELEKLRIAKILVEEMGVNLAGVDVVLRMRQSMIEMRRQFDDIFEDLSNEIRKAWKKYGQK